MAKRKKKRVKREPKPPTWVVYKSFNQTKEEVHFGSSMNFPKWYGRKHELSRVPELAHWDFEDDKIMICRLFKRKTYSTQEFALSAAQSLERSYVHWRNFWVVQTGRNTTLPPRVRKPVKPLRYASYLEPDMEEEAEMEMDN